MFLRKGHLFVEDEAGEEGSAYVRGEVVESTKWCDFAGVTHETARFQVRATRKRMVSKTQKGGFKNANISKTHLFVEDEAGEEGGTHVRGQVVEGTKKLRPPPGPS